MANLKSQKSNAASGNTGQADSAAIQLRIESERARLIVAEKDELALMTARAAPLEAGDDAAVDAIEEKINASRTLQLRLQERIEILTGKLSAAQQAEHAARLDAQYDRTQKARAVAEQLIRGAYVKAAQAVLGVVERLAAIEEFIHAQNRELEREGREAVPSPNEIRTTPIKAIRNDSGAYLGLEPGVRPQPIHLAVVLPSPDATESMLWPMHRQKYGVAESFDPDAPPAGWEARAAAILAELEI